MKSNRVVCLVLFTCLMLYQGMRALAWNSTSTPPVYVTVAGHIEDTDVYANCDSYPDFRAKLLAFADMLEQTGAAFNLQIDYEFLYGAANCETEAMRNETGGLNVIDYLAVYYGYEIDAHQEGGVEEGSDDYADVRWLGGYLTSSMSENVGGLVWENPSQFARLAVGEQGWLYPDYTWYPEVLTLAVGEMHHYGDFSNDDVASGVWRPKGAGTNFWTHDPGERMIYVGPGEHTNWGRNDGNMSTAESVEYFARGLRLGYLPQNRMYTVTLTVPQSVIFDASEYADLVAILNQIAPYVESGQARYVTYSQAARIWTNDFWGQPNVFHGSTATTSRNPVYRFYSFGAPESTYTHLWTINEVEKDALSSWPSWIYEGVAWYALTNYAYGSTPLYRLYEPNIRRHVYTIDPVEYSALTNTSWNGEGVVYYVYATNAVSGVTPVYRFYHSGNQNHHFTVDENEKDTIIATPEWEYSYEGVGFYVFNESTAVRNKIVFCRKVSDADWDIWTMNRDGSEQAVLLDTDNQDRMPRFNCNGTKVAFTRFTSEVGDICVMNAQGGNVINLTEGLSGSAVAGRFSYDGAKICFDYAVSQNDHDIYMMNADGSECTPVVTGSTDDSTPAFSPDGEWLVFQRMLSSDPDPLSAIYKVRIDGTELTELTTGGYLDEMPVFTSLGDRILFKRGSEYPEIYRMESDGSNPVNLSNNAGADDSPAVSPEDDCYAFMSSTSGVDGMEIYTMNTNGTDQTRLTDNSVADFDPSFCLE